jgi:hypothetical protein
MNPQHHLHPFRATKRGTIVLFEASRQRGSMRARSACPRLAIGDLRPAALLWLI